MHQLRVRQWDPASAKPGRIFAFIGRRGSGKSHLMESILYHMRERFDFAIGMSPTEASLETFRKHMPDQWTFNDFQPSKIEQILRVQRKALRDKNTCKSILIWCDDTMYDKATMRNRTVRDLFFNGRHLRITFVFAAQFLMDLGPDLRMQVDYVVACRQSIITERAKLHKYFFGQLEFKDFSAVMDRCTENFSALVLDNTSTSNDAGDCLYWYRAPATLPEYRIGSERFWKITDVHAKSSDECAAEQQALDEQEVLGRHNRSQREPLTVQVADHNGNLFSASSN